MSDKSRRREIGRLVLAVVIFLAFVFGALFAVKDARKFLAAADQVRGHAPALAIAVLATLGAYVCFTVVLKTVANAGGFKITLRQILPTSFVSQAVNNLVSSAGVAGIAIRVYGLGVLGMPPGAAVATSAITTLTGDVIVGGGLLASIAWICVRGTLTRRQEVWMTLFAVLFVAALAAVVQLLRSDKRRAWILDRLAGWTTRTATKLEEPTIEGDVARKGFAADAQKLFSTASANPRLLLVPALFSALDIVCRIVCLQASFAAVGHPLRLPTVVTIFFIGITVGAVSLVPGGLGVTDGALVWSATALVSFRSHLDTATAIAAVAVFRFVYYVVPFGVNALLFRSMQKHAHVLPAKGVLESATRAPERP